MQIPRYHKEIGERLIRERERVQNFCRFQLCHVDRRYFLFYPTFGGKHGRHLIFIKYGRSGKRLQARAPTVGLESEV